MSTGNFTSVCRIKLLNRVEKRVRKHRNSKALVSRLSRAVLGPGNKAPRGHGAHWPNRGELSQGGAPESLFSRRIIELERKKLRI